MNQLEIEYFFPLTEQIPLGLDYTGCDRPKLTIGTGMGLLLQTYPTCAGTTWTTTSINIDQTNVTITSKTKQPLYRRVLYKLLGINWKQI